MRYASCMSMAAYNVDKIRLINLKHQTTTWLDVMHVFLCLVLENIRWHAPKWHRFSKHKSMCRINASVNTAIDYANHFHFVSRIEEDDIME